MRIISTYLNDDGRISGTRADAVVQRADVEGLRVESLYIQPLSADWNSEPAGTFKSGAGPLFALAEASRLLQSGVDLVRISGTEFLRQYVSEERSRKMQVFPGISLPEAYTSLAEAFIEQRGISEEEFQKLASALERNYLRTATSRGIIVKPGGDALVTRLFRRVDCANPVTDFEGELLVASDLACAALGLTGPRVLEVATSEVDDGPENIEELAGYSHLQDVFVRATEGVDIQNPSFNGQLILEAYTCFPPVPLAFLECSGLAQTPSEMMTFLEKNPITVSGGMNFARAPWNNPALRGLIMVAEALKTKDAYGIVHGNGGLGGRQGIALLASDTLPQR